MALKFKLVMRKNLGEDHESIPEKVYAQMVYGDLVNVILIYSKML